MEDGGVEKLWRYIKDNRRNKPVIGLSSIIECQSGKQEPYYLCQVCFSKMEEAHVVSHVISAAHQYHYMKAKHPLVCKLLGMDSRKRTQVLQDKAWALEKQEGFGEAQLVEVEEADYQYITKGTIKEAMAKIQQVQQQENCKMTSMNCLPGPQVQVHTPAYRALWNYLNSKLRRQPVIGLRTIVECHVDGQAPHFICKTCDETIANGFIIGHLISAEHRYHYIKLHHPRLLRDWKNDPDLLEYQDSLMAKAKAVEEATGLGDIQIVKKGKNGIEEVQLLHTDTKRPSATVCMGEAIVKSEPLECPVKQETTVEFKQEFKSCKRSRPVTGSQLPAGRVTQPPTKEAKLSKLKEPTLSSPQTKMVADSEPEMEPLVPVLGPTLPQVQKLSRTPSEESHLAKFMLPFLRGRNQPVIGLKAILECRSFMQPTFYMCLTCVEKLDTSNICQHIVHSRHQYSYTKCYYPRFLDGWVGDMDTVAARVEFQEGTGWSQVMRLEVSAHRAIALSPFHQALATLQAIRRERYMPELWTTTDTESVELATNVPPAHDAPPENLQEVSQNTAATYATHSPNTPPGASKEGSECTTHTEHLGRKQQRPLQAFLSSSAGLSVVGLQKVLECHCMGESLQPYYYLCQACALSLREDFIVEHLCSSFHQYHYITLQWPQALPQEREKAGCAQMSISDLLNQVAAQLIQSEGPGTPQVVQLPKEVYSRLSESSFQTCMEAVRGKDTAEEQPDNCKRLQAAKPRTQAPFTLGTGDEQRGIIARVLPLRARDASAKACKDRESLSDKPTEPPPAVPQIVTHAKQAPAPPVSPTRKAEEARVTKSCTVGSSEVKTGCATMASSANSVVLTKQKINDLIVELIIRKELMDRQLKHVRAPLGAAISTGNTESQQGGSSRVVTISANLHRKGRAEDDKDPFSYENRQFSEELQQSCKRPPPVPPNPQKIRGGCSTAVPPQFPSSDPAPPQDLAAHVLNRWRNFTQL